MSHSVKVTLIADQEICLGGDIVNIHDIGSIILNSNGKIISYSKHAIEPGDAADILKSCHCHPHDKIYYGCRCEASKGYR